MSSFLMRRLLLWACALLLATAAAAQAPNDTGAQVQSFSPEGYVKQVRQVTARFSTAMVALGDPRLEDPFRVTCPVTGHGRWADTRNWVYDFDSDLDGGIRCEFRLKPGLKTVTGAPVSGRSIFRFNTGGPAIISSLPHEGWELVDETQVFLLRLDAAATPQSIEAHAYCSVDGVAEQIPLEVLTGKDRQDFLEQRKALGYDYLELLWKSGSVSDVRVRNRALEKRDELITIVRCRRTLPPASRMTLNWSAGIATASGIATQEDQQLTFKVRSAFTAQVECTRTNAHAGCMPMMPIVVNFTAPVPRALAARIQIRTSDGHTFAPALHEAEQVPTVEGVTFTGPFPEKLPVTVVLPSDLKDDAGRELENAARFPLEVHVDVYPPLVKFSATFGILEAREGGILPVTLRNVEPAPGGQGAANIPAQSLRLEADPKVIADWLHRVEKAERTNGYWADEVWHETTGAQSVFKPSEATTHFNVTKPLGGKPEEVVGIPLGRPGFYVVELQSQALGSALLGRDQPRYVSTSALVTDLAVHFKWGRESSLVWVTRLSDGAPVPEADVTAADFCTGEMRWQGKTGRDGIALVTTSLGEPAGYGGCPWQHSLMVVAQKGQDFSFTESTWDQGIMPQEFGLPVGNESEANIYHTVLDRSLFRAGETVSMKHFLRRHVSAGIAIPDSGGVHKITITHQGSGQSFNLTSTFDTTGVGITTWRIPEEAKLGDYRVTIDAHPSADFKVEQFRLPSMRATVTGPPHPLVEPRRVDLDVHVVYLSGGGAAGLPVKVRTLVEPQPQHFDDYPDYEFDGAPVQEGVTSEEGTATDYDFESQTSRETTRTQTTPLTLDASGSGRVTVASVPTLNGPSRLVAELEYADANGELLTSTGYVRLVPAQVTLGIRRENWVGSPEQLRFRVVALDLNGKPVSGQSVQVSLYQSATYSYRKRLIGGFYSYETTTEVKRLAPTCSGKTNAQGLLVCEVKPGSPGQIIVRAETHDAHGALAGATTSMWVVDNNAWWFGGTSGDRMDVLAEKKEYETGETARLQVRVPFRTATALVTVEREGILSSFVTRLRGNSPIVSVPIDATYAPSAFVSVLAVRGRVAHLEGPKSRRPDEITALVDLTKPAYRLGTTQIKVGWRPHRLLVAVDPEKTVFKVRDKAQIRIHVTTATGQPLPPGTEVAVAAVDEALLDLSPNHSWDLLQSMMGVRGLEVWTSTAQMQVIGKRHYGRKAIPTGGGGGREMDRARELFDSLLFWQPRVPLDAQGEATVSIPLNDSLSSFKVVGVAHGGAQLFGSGGASIRTTQDLILTSGLPPLVREGDRYAATFTVRNTTDHTLSARLQVDSRTIRTNLMPHEIEIPSGQARDLTWDVAAPVGTDHIDWDVTAQDLDGDARDHLKTREQVLPVYPVRTYQATIEQVTHPLSIPAEQPRGAVPGRGGLEITMQSQLAGNLAGAKEYLSLYPYTCFEQLISRAIVLRSREQWDKLMQRLPAYMDADGLLRYFPTDRLEGDDSLTAYVLAIAQESAWPIRDEDRSRLQQGLTQFVEGKIVRRSALPTADLTIRKLQALDALSRYGLARPQMLDSMAFEANLLPTSALLDWIGILERTPDIPNAAPRRQEALAILRARLNFQGTTMGFSTERTDGLWWLMISSDSNANRMLLTVLRDADWREDIPRLVRGALGRQQFGHWNTTVANAWGVLAMEKFSAAFESTPVIGTTTVHYGANENSLSWPQPQGESGVVSLPWQSNPETLQISHSGSGAPWAMVRATAALPLTEPLSTGFKIARSLIPVEQQTAGRWTRGDVVRVHLELQAQSDMSWVVVDDPIPSGASILGSGLANQSNLLQRDDTRTGWAFPAFEERRFDGFRAYYRFVPKGNWTVEYTVRLNNPGTFELPATRVEAMYAPEMLGELPNSPVSVQATAVTP